MFEFLDWPIVECLCLPCHPFTVVLCLVTTSANTWLPSTPLRTKYTQKNTPHHIMYNSPYKIQHDTAKKYTTDREIPTIYLHFRPCWLKFGL